MHSRCRRRLLRDVSDAIEVTEGKAKGGKKIMENKVKDIQKYLEKKGIIVSETAIINAAIKIATRWGGTGVFVSEFMVTETRKR